MSGNGTPLRWGIIGCGDVVERKAMRGLLACPDQTVTIAMRRDRARLEAFRDRFGIAEITTDPEAVIAHPDVDAVYVATSPDAHAEWAVAAARAGKHVLVEKPAGRCGGETRAILDACASAGVCGFASYYRRWLPRARRLRDLLGSGVIGPLVAFDYTLAKTVRDRGGPAWHGDAARVGGGGFQELAGHSLDLLDLLAGPLALRGADAIDVRGERPVEDVVHLVLRGRGADGGPVTGTARYNFASAFNADRLVLEGTRGRIVAPLMSVRAPVRIETDRTLDARKGSFLTRAHKRARNRFRGIARRTERFGRPAATHGPMFAGIAAAIAGDRRDGLDAAMRTATLMDGALESFYGGRETGFHANPHRRDTLRAAARRRGPSRTAAAISPEQRARFREEGWAGPFTADIAGLEACHLPRKERGDLHRSDPQFFRIATHPSIVDVVGALVGDAELSVFKTRVHTKVGHTARREPKHAVVPWHQDVGDSNGGYDAHGRPIETWTVWLALDDVGPESGPLRVLPGTHRHLYGDYAENFHARLEERGVLDPSETERAVPLLLRRGEFVVFHSWLLHGSAPNATDARRAGFNVRFVRNADRDQDDPECIDVSPLALPPTPIALAAGEG